MERISLPPPGTTPVSLADVSPTAAAYLLDFRNRMLRKTEEIDWLKYQQQRVYSDELFMRQPELLRLCERMWLGGMLGYVTESHSEFSAFGVVKGYDSEGTMSIRAVWGECKPNILWQEPPFIRWDPLRPSATWTSRSSSRTTSCSRRSGTCPTGSTGCASWRRCGHGSR